MAEAFALVQIVLAQPHRQDSADRDGHRASASC